MNLKDRKFRLGRYSVSALLLLLILGTSFAAATAYVVLQWTTTATVVANPKVCFVDWSTGTTKANTFDYPVNIFPSITTIDENITYGVWNWNTAEHTTYIRWNTVTNSGNIAKLGLKVYNGTATLYDQYWESIPSFPTAWVQLSPSPYQSTKYTIYINITATSGATATSVFTFNMKVENP